MSVPRHELHSVFWCWETFLVIRHPPPELADIWISQQRLRVSPICITLLTLTLASRGSPGEGWTLRAGSGARPRGWHRRLTSLSLFHHHCHELTFPGLPHHGLARHVVRVGVPAGSPDGRVAVLGALQAQAHLNSQYRRRLGQSYSNLIRNCWNH